MASIRPGTHCQVNACERPQFCRQLCHLHYERQRTHGTTDAPMPRTGELNPSWKGDASGYKAIHLRMSSKPRPESCEQCGTSEGRFEWALRPDVPADELLFAPEGWPYSGNPNHYFNLCKTCHNWLDLGRDACHEGHPLAGDNLYIQPSNGKRFCRKCQSARRRARHERDQATRRELRANASRDAME